MGALPWSSARADGFLDFLRGEGRKEDVPSWLQPPERPLPKGRDLDSPPPPATNSYIRKLQEKSWKQEPAIRTRTFLFERFQKVQPNPFAEPKDQRFFVRLADDK